MSLPSKFKALIVPEFGKAAELRDISASELPPGDVVVKVQYSSLNYKDGLAVTSKGKILRSFPGVPGIDLAGTVVSSESPRFAPGESVLVTGCGLGETRWGGFAEYARVSSDWIVPMPSGLDAKRAMAIGTAGFTAMLSVLAIEQQGILGDSGEILVTGAAGGVGSIAIAILSNLWYDVVASTGRPEEHDFLRSLGASEIIDRATLSAPPSRPLDKARWAGAIDSVGGDTLAHVLSQIKPWGAVAACGLAGGAELNTTVMPFILRGVRLIGIHSVETPMEDRLHTWNRLSRNLPMDKLDSITTVAGLSEVPRLAEKILQGKVRGRTVIDVSA